jgi:adenine-specific DNA-methyltransferase
MIDAIAGSRNSRWLEPSFGHGVFLEQLSLRGVAPSRITGIDLELTPMANDRFASVRRGEDFLSWCSKTEQQFDRIVANPPYVSLLDLPDEARRAARQLVISGVIDALPARSNLWAAFLIGALKLLKEGGSLAFVLPAAWDYADYAAVLRDALPKRFAEWICLRCEEPLFPGVQEGSIVLVGRGFNRAHLIESRISCLRLDDLVAQLKLLGREGSIVKAPLQKQALSCSDGRRLSDLVDIRLGGVTGDATYFLFNESRRKELGLPTSALKPVLTKAAHLRAAYIDKEVWAKLRKKDARVWLFRPSGAALKHPKVKKYMALSHEKGGCDKTAGKVENLDLWHRVPLPRGVHGFISGMSNVGPWIALSSYSALNATNTLYTIRFRGRPSRIKRAELALSLLTPPVRLQLKKLCRRYAAGLAKFEPGDLQALRIPQFTVHGNPVACYREAVVALLSGKMKRATEIANDCLHSISVANSNNR